ncbi:MAG: RsmB/NOP family class I SAM-dependent RNA methyltransferase [Verrucomicrobiales bacterium]|nr:RsmB/NOP family class I SAM-dependent RNA methyltransferase [Verrucomicrobiales bacterium]
MSFKHRTRHATESRPPAYSSAISKQLRELSAKIIIGSDRENPSDVVLRRTLQHAKGISRADAGAISRAVFAYFRWKNWFPARMHPVDVIMDALLMEERFAEDPARFPDADLMEKAVPAWISEELQVTPGWARSLQSRPRLWLRAKQGTSAALMATLRGCSVVHPTLFPDALEFKGEEDLFRTPEFQSGAFEIQDLSSQVVSHLCDPKPGETWWDACAGEGGKTLHLADFMKNKGLIWASDRSDWRLKRLRQRTARAQVFNYRAVAWDGAAKLPTKTRFDGILVDAPCSGVGTWQRNPQARWTTSLNDVKELAEVQIQLLRHVAPALKPGATLVYAVCTLTRSETEQVVAKVAESIPSLLPCAFERQIPGARTSGNTVWLWPQEFGGNGMFIARWKKAAV